MSLSLDDAKLYDRQIRLWGLQAQARIQSSSLLVVGSCAGFLGETTKNLVLAGIGSVCLADDYSSIKNTPSNQVVTPNDLATGFLLRKSDIGKLRSECCVRQLSILNPNVKISCFNKSANKNWMDSFDMLILGDVHDPLIISELNDICRKHNIAFWAAGASGFYGYIFTDLGNELKYVQEQKLRPGSQDEEIKKENFIQSFISFKDVYSFQFNQPDSKAPGFKRFKRKVDPLFFYFQLCWQFIEKYHRVPFSDKKAGSDSPTKSPQKNNNDEMLMNDLVLLYSKKHSVDLSSIVDFERLKNFAKQIGIGYTPTCAILGGMIAQEVLKYLSGKEQPFVNFFLLDSWETLGVVCNIGCPAPTPC